jgi:hypothetical protein
MVWWQGVEAELLRAVLPSSELERRDLSGHNSQSFPQVPLPQAFSSTGLAL